MNSIDPSAGAAGVGNNRGGISRSNRGNFGGIGNRPHSRGYNGNREAEAEADPYIPYITPPGGFGYDFGYGNGIGLWAGYTGYGSYGGPGGYEGYGYKGYGDYWG